MINTDSIRSVLEDLGYKLRDKGPYWQCAALYRGGDNETALQIYKDSGTWKDYVKDTPFQPFKQLLVLTLNTNDPKQLSKYLNQDDIRFLSEKGKNTKRKTEEEKLYPEEWLAELLPHHQFYQDRGIDLSVLKKFKGGYATKGSMYQRYTFPIYNRYGQIHGFSGRDMTSKKDAKWKHMGKKANWIYPHYIPNIDKIDSDFIIIVESIGDCLNLFNYGYTNVVVSFGLDISSTLSCWMIEKGFSKIFISFNNDKEKSNNRGLDAAIKNYLKLLNYFSPDLIRICLPTQNDFGDMNEDDFEQWDKKLKQVAETDQSKLVISKARNLNKNNKISKNLMKKISLLEN
tara:strand:- start:12238 stop:13269 length:1032 start_codon:yes stop_codon:yes gene_type:complete